MTAINSSSSSPFQPSWLLRNPHVQTILSSSAVRRRIVNQQTHALIAASQEKVINCSDNVRLLGEYSPAPQSTTKLVIMIHGWEGCIESNYMLSCGAYLYEQGYSVFRLNLRDHGNSKHLNLKPYNSARITEILDAVAHIQQTYAHQRTYLIGFSLGGNFALRVAANAAAHHLVLERIVAICPVISPNHTINSLENGPQLYHQHFVKLWKRSLLAKLQFFPELNYRQPLSSLHTLQQMNNYFVPRYTNYSTLNEYYNAYRITNEHLAAITTPVHIIFAEDDPVVMCEDLKLLHDTPKLVTIETTRYGGHCAFLENLRCRSWIDRRIAQLVA